MGAFGGSFLNHFWLICACTPKYPGADQSPAKDKIAVVEPDGVSLKLADNSPKSAIDGAPKFVRDGNITPDFFAVNTMQPPYQPSANKPAKDGDPALADPANPTTLPPQTDQTIGDLLSGKGISWAWYGGAWQATLDGQKVSPAPVFQYHHQPFNYYADMAPGTTARAEHLKDGGVDGAEFIKAIDGLPFGSSREQGIVRDNRFYHAGMKLTMAFPKGWTVQNERDRLLVFTKRKESIMQLTLEKRPEKKSPREFLLQRPGVRFATITRSDTLAVHGMEGFALVTKSGSPLDGGEGPVRWAVLYRGTQAFVVGAASRSSEAGAPLDDGVFMSCIETRAS